MESNSFENFDPYDAWFQIPPHEQPPNHYRLLGLSLYESRTRAIEDAYEQRMLNLHSRQTGPRAAYAEEMKNELARVARVLLDAHLREEYDSELRSQLPLRSVPVHAVATPPEPPPIHPEYFQEPAAEEPTLPWRLKFDFSPWVRTLDGLRTTWQGAKQLQLIILAAAVGFLLFTAWRYRSQIPFVQKSEPPAPLAPTNLKDIFKAQYPEAYAENEKTRLAQQKQPAETATPLPPKPTPVPQAAPSPAIIPMPPTIPAAIPHVPPPAPLPLGLGEDDPRGGELFLFSGGQWFVKDNILNVKTTEEEILVFGDPNWQNYQVTLEFEKEVSEIDSLGILFCVRGQNEYCRCMMYKTDQTWLDVDVVQTFEGAEGTPHVESLLHQPIGTISAGYWKSLNMTIRGTEFSFSLKHNCDVKINNLPFPSGAIGIRTVGTSAKFRDIKVASLDSPHPVLWEGVPQQVGRAKTTEVDLEPLAIRPLQSARKEYQKSIEKLQSRLITLVDAKLAILNTSVTTGKNSKMFSTGKEKGNRFRDASNRELLEQLRKEKILLEQFGYLPFSRPMIRELEFHCQDIKRAQDKLHALIYQQIAKYEEEKQTELAAILLKAKETLIEKKLVGEWRGSSGEWKLYSDFSAESPHGPTTWSYMADVLTFHWMNDKGTAMRDVCYFPPLATRFEGTTVGGIPIRGVAIYPEIKKE